MAIQKPVLMTPIYCVAGPCTGVIRYARETNGLEQVIATVGHRDDARLSHRALNEVEPTWVAGAGV